MGSGHRSTLCRTIGRMGSTRKKGHSCHETRRVLEGCLAGDGCRGTRSSGLVFVDECGLHISLAPMNGYSPKGERLRLKLPPIRVQNTTLLASMTTEGMGTSMAVKDRKSVV